LSQNSISKTDATSIDGSAEELKFLYQFFERSVRRFPDRIAVDVPPGINRPDRRTVTYRELDHLCNRVASLIGHRVKQECVVAILLPRRSAYLYAAQLGILKTGAAYTCIDPVFPDEQLRSILEDAQAVALLTDAEGCKRAAAVDFEESLTINIIDTLKQFEIEPKEVEPPKNPEWLTPSTLAYVIYTSGTTGRPKGVMIENASICNLVAADLDKFQLSPDERISQNSSSAYDSSIEEIWFAFASGATLVVADEDTTRLGPDLIDWLRRERITLFCPPPTLLRTTGCEHPEIEIPDLKFVYVGGEALPLDVAEKWVRGRRLENGYGPTECTITAMHETVVEGEQISIGRPVRNLKAWVLDESLKAVPDGERGELCLGGIGLARGYNNRPELTAEKFPTHPEFGRIYRTGDLVHRDPDGRFFYHSRIDSQVKVRGYRIELEAIEARLAECEGVRDAACRVQENGAQKMIVAFVVSDNANDPRLFDEIRSSLTQTLPLYMVPSRFAFISRLPRSVGGKLNRDKLPRIESGFRDQNEPVTQPRTPIEATIERAFRVVVGMESAIDIHDDFFHRLGGDSLRAAELVSYLRNESSTAGITVRDIYEARTIAELAKRVSAPTAVMYTTSAPLSSEAAHPLLATTVQVIWLLGCLVVLSTLIYVTAFDVVPFLLQSMGLLQFLVLCPILVFLLLIVYTPLSVLVAATIKKTLIGKYTPMRAPVWGSFYVRNWIVRQSVRIIPWKIIEGTIFQSAALRALGARVGKRVHIHRGVNLLQGGWDLLEIGDDVTLGQDTEVRLVEYNDGHILVGPVFLGDGSTLEVRAGVSGNTILESGSYLTALSNLPAGARIPAGERWEGIPAGPAGNSDPTPQISSNGVIVSPLINSILMMLSRIALWILLALCVELPTIVFSAVKDVSANDFFQWLLDPWDHPSEILFAFLLVTAPVPITVIIQAIITRALGRVRPAVINRWSLAYIRVWLKTEIVDSAGTWLSGTVFWPLWLRLAGMTIGRGCEISTIIDVVPELVSIGDESFFADGIYLCGPRVHRGTVDLAPARLGKNTFLGNHSVIPGGQDLPDNLLIGVCTVANDKTVRTGTAWFGQPPFELPRREEVEFGRQLTHEPNLIRYLDRLFWETLRNGLPVFPLLVIPFWYQLLAETHAAWGSPLFFLVASPLITLGEMSLFCLLVLALKWILLGRVRPGIHAFWSCWCSRWDFLYVAWGFYGSTILSFLEGTLILSWYLRAMGVKIGRRVILAGSFAQVVDPDMLQFEDGATVSCQFQAHTFEDRVLKIDRVNIRRQASVGSQAVLLYGADVGAGTQVAPHSVVMKRETLRPGMVYSGCPTRSVRSFIAEEAASSELVTAPADVVSVSGD
jgi:non-ribosomal peptide synthetase-like protein